MAGATARKSLTESVPEEYGETARSLIETLRTRGGSRSQCDALMRTIILIARNDHEGSAEKALSSIRDILASKNFKLQFLEPLNSVVERSSNRAAYALDALERIFSNPKLNQYILHAISLATNTARESTPEALSCLEKILENPGFPKTPDQFNFTFATRFDEWISQTLKRCQNSGNKDLTLRALSSLMGNPNFGPEDFNSNKTAIRVGKAVGLAAGSKHGGRIDLEALFHLNKNPNIRPEMVDEKLSAELSLVIDKTVRNSKTDTTCEDTLTALNRVLENRHITREDLDAANGLISNITGKSREGTGMNLDSLHSLLEIDNLDPKLLDAIRLAAVKARTIPNFFLKPVSSIARKETWALAGKDVDGLAGLLSEAAGDSQSVEARRNVYVYLGEILRGWEGDSRILKFLNRTVELSGDMLPQVVHLLERYLNNRKLKDPPDELLISGLVSTCRSIWTGPNDDKTGFEGLGYIVSSQSFNLDMLKDGGLVGTVIKHSGPNARKALDELGDLFERKLGDSAEVQSVVRKIVMQSGQNSALALKAFKELAHENLLDKYAYQSLDFILPMCRSRCDLVLPIWSSLLKQGNSSNWEMLKPYGEKIVALAFTAANKSGNRQFEAIRSIKLMINPGPSPSVLTVPEKTGFMLGHIDLLISLAQRAGPDCPFVLEAVKEQLTHSSRKIPQETILSQGYLDSMVKLFRTVSVLSWPKQDRALSILADAMGSNKTNPLFILTKAQDIANLVKDHRSEVLAAYLPLWCGYYADDHLQTNLLSTTALVSPAIKDERIVSWIIRQLDSVPEKDREMRVSSIGNFLHSCPKELVDIAMDDRAYEAGRKLADSLTRAPKNDPVTYANFAYAISTIGKEKTAKLYSEQGIEFFFRYSKEMLVGLYADLDPSRGKERPLLMVVMNKSDYNGAFYNEGAQLDILRGRYRVIISETDKEEGFYSNIEKAGKRFGKLPGTLVIAGHGSSDSISLGPDKTDERDKLDLSDIVDMVKLRYLLGPKPTIILDACSTGYSPFGIGSLISKSVPDATLFAPEVPTSIKKYYFSSNGKVRVEFEESSAAFLSGQKVGGKE